MVKKQEAVAKFGLIGRDIEYSLSRRYFAHKFVKEGLAHSYDNFDCEHINAVQHWVENQDILGYNVTIPYKQEVLSLIDELDAHASAIGAVNTIKRLPDGKLKGFNTDWLGFKQALEIVFDSAFAKAELPQNALILGTGGASKGVNYALEQMGVNCQFVSRKRSKETIHYDDIDRGVINDHLLIVNCTPLGTYPNIDDCPDLPYAFLGINHIAFDLIYNPAETTFLKQCKEQGATVANGLHMLELQAEASWDIWHTS